MVCKAMCLVPKFEILFAKIQESAKYCRVILKVSSSRMLLQNRLCSSFARAQSTFKGRGFSVISTHKKPIAKTHRSLQIRRRYLQDAQKQMLYMDKRSH